MYQPKSYRKFLAASLSATMVASVAPGAVFANEHAHSFTDIDLEGENLEVIEKLVEAGIINGFPDNTFRPHASITREQAALMMYRALELEGATDVVNTLSQFNDIDPDHRSAVEIAAVIEAGIFKGYNGNLHMGDVISRQEMASVIVRTFNLELNGETTEFVDEDTIHVSHIEAVKILQSWGVLLGMPHGDGYRFGASDELTRLAFSLMLTRSIETVEEIEADEPIEGEEEPEDELPGNEEENEDEQVDEEEEEVTAPTPTPPGGGWSPGPVTPTPDPTPVEPTIEQVTLAQSEVNVEVGQEFTLPTQATATFSDETTQELNINWGRETISFDEPGEFEIEGAVQGYDKLIKILFVVEQEGISLSNEGKEATVTNEIGLKTAFENEAITSIKINSDIEYSGEKIRTYVNVEVSENVEVDFGGILLTSVVAGDSSKISNFTADRVNVEGSKAEVFQAEIKDKLTINGDNVIITKSQLNDVDVDASVSNITFDKTEDKSTSVYTFSGGGKDSVNLTADTNLTGEVIVVAHEDIKFSGDGVITGLVRHNSNQQLYIDVDVNQLVITSPSNIHVTSKIEELMASVSAVNVFIDDHNLIKEAKYREGVEKPSVNRFADSSNNNNTQVHDVRIASTNSTNLEFKETIDTMSLKHYLNVARIQLQNNEDNVGLSHGNYHPHDYSLLREIYNFTSTLDLDNITQYSVDINLGNILNALNHFNRGRVFLDESFRDILSYIKEQERRLSLTQFGTEPGQFEDVPYFIFEHHVQQARKSVENDNLTQEGIDKLRDRLTVARNNFENARNPLIWDFENSVEGQLTFSIDNQEDKSNNVSGVILFHLDENREVLSFANHTKWEDGNKLVIENIIPHDDSSLIKYVAYSDTHLYEGTFNFGDFESGSEIKLNSIGKDYKMVKGFSNDPSLSINEMQLNYIKENEISTFSHFITFKGDNVYLPNKAFSLAFSGLYQGQEFVDAYQLDGNVQTIEEIEILPTEMQEVEIQLDSNGVLDGLDWYINNLNVYQDHISTGFLHSGMFKFSNRTILDRKLRISKDAYFRQAFISADIPERDEEIQLGLEFSSRDNDSFKLDTTFSLNVSDEYTPHMDIYKLSDMSQLLNLSVVDSYNNRLTNISRKEFMGSFGLDALITVKFGNESLNYYRPLGQLWRGDNFSEFENYTGEVIFEVSFPDFEVVLPPDQTFIFNMVSQEDNYDNEGTEATPIDNDEVIYEEVEDEVSATIDYNN